MIIASKKRKENIAEYLIYMWQIEDLIRLNGLDIDKIRHTIIDRFDTDPDGHKKMEQWYESLIDMMRREDVVQKGHLQINKNIIGELADLNRRVLADPRFDTYRGEYYKTLPYIVELRAKSGGDPAGEIETCFNALYGTLLLRLAGKPVSDDTQKAMTQISAFIALLAKYFHMDEENQLFKDDSTGSGSQTPL